MNTDRSIPGRIVLQPETEYEQQVLHAMEKALSGLPAGETGGLLAYFTAEIPDYPDLDTALHEQADYWKDVGYRALVILWRE